MMVVQVDDTPDLIVVIDQDDMPANRDVAVILRGWRQTMVQIGRRGVYSSAQVMVHCLALTQAVSLLGRQPVVFPEPCGGWD